MIIQNIESNASLNGVVKRAYEGAGRQTRAAANIQNVVRGVQARQAAIKRSSAAHK